MRRFAVFLFIFLVPSFSNSSTIDYIPSGMTKISFISSYNEYGDGDIQFKIKDPISECDKGYWMNKKDPGFQANFSMLLAAFQSGTTVKIHALPHVRWPGSNSNFCKLYSIEYYN